MSAYEEWEDGFLSPQQALRTLVVELGEVESDLQPLDTQRNALREQIGNIVARMDNQRAEIKGFGRVLITAPGFSEGYDTAQLNAMLATLRERGDDLLADWLESCKTKRMRSGGLRIERERAKS